MNPGRWLRATLGLVFASLVLGMLCGAIVRLPGLPYNVAGLFWRGGSLLNLWFFGIYLIGLGAFGAIVALHVRRARWAMVWLAPWTIVAGALSFTLLTLSVTPESLHDIVGSPTIVRLVSSAQPGALPALVVDAAGQNPQLLRWLEGSGRYSALHAPFVVFTALGVVAALAWVTGSAPSRSQIAGLLVTAIALLWLGKVVVIDWAGTSNVKELIAPDSFFGLSGLFWLQLAIAVASMDAVVLWALRAGHVSWWLGLLVLVVSLPLGWFLLGRGLAPEVGQGLSWSPAQFLLGANRASTLSALSLFTRWCIVQIALAITMAGGIALILGRGESPQASTANPMPPLPDPSEHPRASEAGREGRSDRTGHHGGAMK